MRLHPFSIYPVVAGAFITATFGCSRQPTPPATNAAPSVTKSTADIVARVKGVSPAELQGRWKLIKMERNGQDMDITERYSTRGLRFAVDRIFLLDTVAGTETDTHLVVTAHDPEQSPKQFDLTNDAGPEVGKVMLGIYTITADELIILMRDSAKGRPTTFDSSKIIGVEKETYSRMKK